MLTCKFSSLVKIYTGPNLISLSLSQRLSCPYHHIDHPILKLITDHGYCESLAGHVKLASPLHQRLNMCDFVHHHHHDFCISTKREPGLASQLPEQHAQRESIGCKPRKPVGRRSQLQAGRRRKKGGAAMGVINWLINKGGGWVGGWWTFFPLLPQLPRTIKAVISEGYNGLIIFGYRRWDTWLPMGSHYVYKYILETYLHLFILSSSISDVLQTRLLLYM